MATKKAIKKSTKAAKATKAKKSVSPKKQTSVYSRISEYLRFGESYTSLILGVIVVIIATVLLLSFVNNRQNVKPETVVTPTIADVKTFAITTSPSPTITSEPSPSPTNVPAETLEPTQPSQAKPVSGGTYTVAAGDDLWKIAEKAYGSGYNWVDIAKANNLVNPSDIHVGNKLILPKVNAKDATVTTGEDEAKVSRTSRIVGTSYKIAQGDDLWDIAVRAYGDGYQWPKIAKENNIANPNIIHVGNVLKIPRQ